MSNIELAISGDKEAALRYGKLSDAATTAKMKAYYAKCAMESATAAARKQNTVNTKAVAV